MYQGRLCVPDIDYWREKFLEKSHSSRYSIHSEAIKMYYDLQKLYGWNGMKRDIAGFAAKCPNCQKGKVEHQKPGSLLQDIFIPSWKWDDLKM